jgi:threonine dehydrogenase-like Zn-dependent dehydrogenase
VVNDAVDVAPYGDLPAELAVALEPLACVIGAVDRLPDPAGRTVAVIGQGPIGVLFSHVLKARGAGTVIGVDPVDRSGFGQTFGVDRHVTAMSDRWASFLPSDERPSIVVESVGHQISTLRDAISAVADEGVVFAFGVPDDDIYPVDMWQVLRRSLTLMSGVTRERRAALAAAVQYVAEFPDLLKQYVTTVLPVAEVNRAFQLAVTPAPERVKVVLTARGAASGAATTSSSTPDRREGAPE